MGRRGKKPAPKAQVFVVFTCGDLLPGMSIGRVEELVRNRMRGRYVGVELRITGTTLTGPPMVHVDMPPETAIPATRGMIEAAVVEAVRTVVKMMKPPEL